MLPSWVLKLPKAPGADLCPKHKLDKRVLCNLPECPACAGWLGDVSNLVCYATVWRSEADDPLFAAYGAFTHLIDSMESLKNASSSYGDTGVFAVFSVHTPTTAVFVRHPSTRGPFSQTNELYRIYPPGVKLGRPAEERELIAIERIELE